MSGIAAVLLLSVGVILTYLVYVFFAFLIIWSFSLAYSPWIAALGLWAIVVLLRAAFRS